MYPPSPQYSPHEFFNIQFPSWSNPTTNIAWLASSGLLEQLENISVESSERTNCINEASIPTDTGCLLTASYKAVILPEAKAINGVLSFNIFCGEYIFWQSPATPESEEVVWYYY